MRRCSQHWGELFLRACAVGRLLPAYFVVGVLKRVLPLPVLTRWAWRPASSERGSERQGSIIANVLRAGRLTGVPERDCLCRSLVLYRELSRAGVNPTLVVGFRRTDCAVQGHAWVTVDKRVVGEEESDVACFAPAFSFGRAGHLLSLP